MKDQILPIPIGTVVAVRDGNPEPPKRFNRKHADWRGRNYDAVVVSYDAPNKWQPEPTYCVQDMDYLTGVLRVTRHAKPDTVTPIPGWRLFPVKGGIVELQ